MGCASLFARVSWASTCALVLAACPSDSKEDSGTLDADVSVDAGHDAAVDAAPQDTAVGDPSQDAAPEPFVCNVQPPTSCPQDPPRYADVQPIFTRRCGVCHGQDWTGEWPLDTYSHVADWEEEIRGELVTCGMPPRDSGVPLPEAERMAILTWLRCDLPR